MKILMVCQHYYPERFQNQDICEQMVQDGHEVTVLTGLPNYETGFVPEEYKDFKMITTALKSNGWAIIFVENQTEEYALTAVLQNTESSLYVHENIRNNNLCIKSIYDEIIKRHEFLS